MFVPHCKTGKYGQRAATWNAAGRPITDFDASYVDPLVVAAGDDGRITIVRSPEVSSPDAGALSFVPVATLSAPAQRAIEVAQFHPTASGILLSVQASQLHAWDVQTQRIISTLSGPEKGLWSACWSHDGRLVQTAAKDHTISLWDVRQDNTEPVQSTVFHQGFSKPSRIASVGDLVFTTGFSKMRDRECALWDPRNFTKPIVKTSFDTNTGVLIPMVDQARKIVYLSGRVSLRWPDSKKILLISGKADMTLRWVEIGNSTTLTAGMPAALPTSCLGAAILPATYQNLDVMQAEIAKLVLLSQDSIIPVTMQVPRRVSPGFSAVCTMYETESRTIWISMTNCSRRWRCTRIQH